MTLRKTWSEFVGKRSESFVRGLVDDASFVQASDLVDMSTISLATPHPNPPPQGGREFLVVCTAYSKEELI